MLHEILLSLSGHPSPLLRPPPTPEADALAGITPPERQLLSSAGHISDLNTKLMAYSSELATSHPSTICRAVATAISTVHLAAFQKKVLDVEASVLRNDPDLVGAYNIVPLTAVMSEFQQWTRRLEWLWDTVRFMAATGGDGDQDGQRQKRACHGAMLIDRLRDELQSGYQDVAATAESLVKAAETAWLKQVSAWVLYGRLPSFGADDFFVQTMPGAAPGDDYVCVAGRLPSFVTGATASSMLFIGKSLNHLRAMKASSSSCTSTTTSAGVGIAHVAAKLPELSTLSLPLDASDFSKAIKAIRTALSQNTLQQMLPLAKVSETMHLLREFFLLGRGEFAMALTHEADEMMRNRWRRLAAHQGSDQASAALNKVAVKDGEVAAVLNRTWAVLVSMQGRHADEDDQLDLARSLVRLHLTRSRPPPPLVTGPGLHLPAASHHLAASPFRTMLFSVPATLAVDLPSPLDMVIPPSDLHLYSCINAYLLALRRAHMRLTNLWKITSLRRHHPSPSPRRTGSGERTAPEAGHALLRRERWSRRASLLRRCWTTASAAIFFLGQTEAFFQTEIVAVLWDGFCAWLLPRGTTTSHDPESLSSAHTLYLRTLTHRLLLARRPFTTALHALLTHVDVLTESMHRLHSLFTSADLLRPDTPLRHDDDDDDDEETRHVLASLHATQQGVRHAIRDATLALQSLESDAAFVAEREGCAPLVGAENDEGGDADANAKGAYVPARVGGVDRLLIKLDGWR